VARFTLNAHKSIYTLCINDLRKLNIRISRKVRIKVRIEAPFSMPKIARTGLFRTCSLVTHDQ
jgi:hypothetical protein